MLLIILRYFLDYQILTLLHASISDNLKGGSSKDYTMMIDDVTPKQNLRLR